MPSIAKLSDASTTVATAVLAAALGQTSPESAAAVIDARKSWRTSYSRHIVAVTVAACASKPAAVSIATAGLEAAHQHMVFEAEDGSSRNLLEAVKECAACAGQAQSPSALFTPLSVSGDSQLTATQTVTYQGKSLQGKDLNKQMDKWVKSGIAEPSAATSIRKLASVPASNLAGKLFVIFGGAGEMAPTVGLLRAGATIVMIELPRPEVWQRLISEVRKTPGTLIFPSASGAAAVSSSSSSSSSSTDDAAIAASAGCNILTQTPDIARFIVEVATAAGCTDRNSLILGNYCYLDGAKVEIYLVITVCPETNHRRQLLLSSLRYLSLSMPSLSLLWTYSRTPSRFRAWPRRQSALSSRRPASKSRSRSLTSSACTSCGTSR